MMQHWIGEAGRDQPYNNVRAAVSVDRVNRKEGCGNPWTGCLMAGMMLFTVTSSYRDIIPDCGLTADMLFSVSGNFEDEQMPATF